MIATFLLGELDSPRHADRLKSALATHGGDPELIRLADATDERANRIRRDVLSTCRGWGQYESVFGGLPAEDVTWMWTELSESDLRERVFCIAYYFEERLGTRRPSEVAGMVQRLPKLNSSSQAILNDVRAGRMPEPPILLADPDFQRLVILEGHNRVISYLVDPDVVPFPIRAMVGVSSRIEEWSEW